MKRLLPPPGPSRLLVLASLIGSTGIILVVTTLVLYVTREVGLSGGEAALGLTLGAAAGALVSVPLGHLADRLGARTVLVSVTALSVPTVLAYVWVDSLAAYLLVVVVDVALLRAGSAVRQGVVARVLPIEGRVRARAILRSAVNAGGALGSGLATVGLALDSRAGFHAVFVIDALGFAVVAVLFSRLPRLAPVEPEDDGPALVVLRDRPYLAVLGLSALLHVHNAILDVGLPLWVSERTDVPTAIVGVIFTVNCLVVMVFSVRVAGTDDTPAVAARGALRAGGLVLLACALLAGSGSVAIWLGAILLVGGMLVQSVGEMQEAASQWALSLGLAPEERQGQYQGASSAGLTVATLIGPLAMAAIVATGPAGWLVFGTLTLLVGAAMVPTVGWAVGQRERAALSPA